MKKPLRDRLKARELTGQTSSKLQATVRSLELMGNRRLLKGSNLGHLLYSEYVAGTRMRAGKPTGQPFS